MAAEPHYYAQYCHLQNKWDSQIPTCVSNQVLVLGSRFTAVLQLPFTLQVAVLPILELLTLFQRFSRSKLVQKTVTKRTTNVNNSRIGSTWLYIQHIARYLLILATHSTITCYTFNTQHNTWLYLQHIASMVPLSAFSLAFSYIICLGACDKV